MGFRLKPKPKPNTQPQGVPGKQKRRGSRDDHAGAIRQCGHLEGDVGQPDSSGVFGFFEGSFKGFVRILCGVCGFMVWGFSGLAQAEFN